MGARGLRIEPGLDYRISIYAVLRVPSFLRFFPSFLRSFVFCARWLVRSCLRSVCLSFVVSFGLSFVHTFIAYLRFLMLQCFIAPGASFCFWCYMLLRAPKFELLMCVIVYVLANASFRGLGFMSPGLYRVCVLQIPVGVKRS